MFVPQSSCFVVRWQYAWLYLLTSLLLSTFFLTSCSGLNSGGISSSPTTKPTPSQLPLTKLHWCNKPFILFRDEHAAVKVTVTSTATATPGSTPDVTATASGTPNSTPTAATSPTTT